MKTLLLITGLFFVTPKYQQTVYICKGSMSERYHLSPKCRGLDKCTTKIYAVTLSEAKKIGRTLCKYED